MNVDASTVVLGIETSCDETAAALVMGGNDVISSVVSSQIEIHADFGGVVPEIASRAHLSALNPVIARTIVEAGVDDRRIDAVACTYGPGLIGALLIGVSAAKALALAWDVPFVAVNHLEAHLYSAFLEDPTLEFPLVVLLVSGGHTMLIEMQDHGRYRMLGQTIDDAAGEAFDKVARFLELGYPGGPAIDAAALHGDPDHVRFPRAMSDDPDNLDFSFSGLKTAVVNYVRKHPDVSSADVAASFQMAVVDVLVTKTRRAAQRVGAKGIVLRRWRRRQLAAARGAARRLRQGRRARVPAEPGDVHRQRGDDRRRRLVSTGERRPEPARHGRQAEPQAASDRSVRPIDSAPTPPSLRTGGVILDDATCLVREFEAQEAEQLGPCSQRGEQDRGRRSADPPVPLSLVLPLRIGPFTPAAPVVLAPMAGVTNAPFRAMCRTYAPDLVYVNEMVMAAAVVHRNDKTRRMMTFGPDERPRSLQIYGSDPDMLGRAVHTVCDEGRVDHVDLNFGCPAAKVTRRGGGAAVPAKPRAAAGGGAVGGAGRPAVRRAGDRQVPDGSPGRPAHRPRRRA